MSSKLDFKLVLALIIVGIVWGTTYLGIRIAVETMQPWFVTSIRQGIAALIVFVILLFKKELAWIGWRNFRIQLLLAVLILVFANGFTTLAEKSIPSGLTSIMSAISPVIIFIGSVLFGIQKATWKLQEITQASHFWTYPAKRPVRLRPAGYGASHW